MRMIDSVLALSHKQNMEFDEAAEQLVTEYKAKKQRLPGFGHRLHTADPRATRLFDLAEQTGIENNATTMLKSLQAALNQQSKRQFPINVDGAIAAVLLDINIPAELGNTFFMMARMPGLVAQVYEEKTRERPMRMIHPTNYKYDGPSSG